MANLPYKRTLNVIVYRSIADLKNKIHYYIFNEEGKKERVQIAARGHVVAMHHHRSWHVMERLVLGDWSD